MKNSIQKGLTFILICVKLKEKGDTILKKLLVVLSLLIMLPASAQTVSRWQYEVSRACEPYVTTNHTPNDLYACLIEKTDDFYVWRPGWETPVDAKILGILAAYDGSELNLTKDEKMELAEQFRQKLPLMYRYKMLNHPTRMTKFTQADVQRIWSAKL